MGAVAHHLEAAGIATTGISLVREHTEAMGVPRFLWVPFELGRPFGAPHQPDFQRRVLRCALALLERTDGPVVLDDFPDDAPVPASAASSAEGAGEGWSCPITFTPPAPDEPEPELVSETRAEIRRLAPWAEVGGRAPAPNSGLSRDEMVTHLATLIEPASSDPPNPDPAAGDDPAALVERTRLVCDDLRTWYLHAATNQPGAPTTSELHHWFWRQTALAHLLGAVAGTLLASPNRRLQAYAQRALIPRDHLGALLPQRPTS